MKAILAVCMFMLWQPVFGLNVPDTKLIPAGSVAPSFSLPTPSGDRVSLDLYCGKTLSKPYFNNVRHTVILSFWATYCKPCQKELPELQAFAQKHRKDNVIVLCVSIDKEGADIVAPFIKEKGYTTQVLLDPYTRTAERYGVHSLPALFVIDTMGVIRFTSHGYDENSPLEPKLEGVLRAIREGTKIDAADEGGAVVPVDTAMSKSSASDSENSSGFSRHSPKQRWNAIARVECGEPIEKVAASIGVTPSELHAWYDDLKKAATAIWAADSGQ